MFEHIYFKRHLDFNKLGYIIILRIHMFSINKQDVHVSKIACFSEDSSEIEEVNISETRIL